MPSRSRFADIGRWPARILIAAVLVLGCWGAALSTKPVPRALSPIGSDAALYRAVAQRVAGGENFYAATTAEQRARNYPLKPFVTVRSPVLAGIIGAVGGLGHATLILNMLALATVVALALCLRRQAGSRLRYITGAVIAAVSLTSLADPALVVWHEIWATLLLALGLAVYSRRTWAISLAILLAAALVRELAMPMLAVMAFVALIERRKAEAAAWCAALLVFALALTGHAMTIATYLQPGDLQSPGWSGFGGWPFILLMAKNATILGAMPQSAVAFAVPLALLGWASWASPVGLRGALYLFGCTVAFMAIGRPDNFYWGAMFASLLPIGLAFAPLALADLAYAAR